MRRDTRRDEKEYVSGLGIGCGELARRSLYRFLVVVAGAESIMVVVVIVARARRTGQIMSAAAYLGLVVAPS